MRHRVVVLGGGTAGTLVANRLRRAYSHRRAEITVVDQNDRHLYQPGLLFVPFGRTGTNGIVRNRERQLHRGISYVEGAIDHVELGANQVRLEKGMVLDYDVLVVATGAELRPEETEGLTGPGWMENVFTFYSPEGATALAAALPSFDEGRLVVGIIDLPIKCPVAPLEFCFLADWHFRRRGVRDCVQITYVTPLDAAFTRPVASERLGDMLAGKGIDLVTEFNTGSVDGVAGRLTSYDDRHVDFDMAVMVPLHVGASYVGRSPGLGDEFDFVPTDPNTLAAKAAPNVFAIGDATDLPAPKAGSVAHFEGEVLAKNIRRYLAGEPLLPAFDGHANCFVETGSNRAMLIDYNYDTEPLPGHFPGAVGLPLLSPSRASHLGKLAFQSVYWHAILPGRHIPFVHAAMPTAGKVRVGIGAKEG